MSFYTELKALCAIPSVSGREAAVRAAIEKKIAPLTDEVYTDSMGNLIAKKKGIGGSKSVICARIWTRSDSL